MVYSKIVLSSVRAISQGLNVAPITAVMNREVCACVRVFVCVCVCTDWNDAFLCISDGARLARRWPAARFLNYLRARSACFGNALNKNNGLSFNKSHCEDSTYQTTPSSLEANIGRV